MKTSAKMEWEMIRRRAKLRESVVPCVHKRVKKLGLQGQRGREGKRER